MSDNTSNVVQLRKRGYIEVEDCDLELEEALREAYANNGPVVSLIAEFRERCIALSPPPDSGVVEALEKCRDKFREYEGIHTLKLRDYKGEQPLNYAANIQFKIDRNREMADMCDAALAKVRP